MDASSTSNHYVSPNPTNLSNNWKASKMALCTDKKGILRDILQKPWLVLFFRAEGHSTCIQLSVFLP